MKNLLKIHRQMSVMNQTELAKASGLTRAAISKIEAGKSKPSLETAIKLSEAMGITLDRFAGLPSGNPLDERINKLMTENVRLKRVLEKIQVNLNMENLSS